MLNNDERRRLAAIEQQLRKDDPRLARRLAEWPPRMKSWRMTVVAVVLAVLCAAGVLLGFLVRSTVLVACGLCLLAVPVWLSHRNRRGKGCR